MHHDLLRLARDYIDSIRRADELGALRFFAATWRRSGRDVIRQHDYDCFDPW